VAADDVFTLGSTVHEVIDFAGCAVEHGNLETVALHVQNQVLTHYGEADQANITFLFCGIHSGSIQSYIQSYI
jgi:hypothetical protein